MFSVTLLNNRLRYHYYLLASSLAILFWILFSVFDQRLFFTPYLVFYIPKEGTMDFILSTFTSVMFGLIITMVVYRVINLRNKSGMRRSLSLSMLPGIIAILSSSCLGCSVYIGTLIVPMFSITTTGILYYFSAYDTPIRFASLTLLCYSVYCMKKNTNNMICSKQSI